MQLKVLGSSSKGNCYLLDNGKEALMIECGVAFKHVQHAVDFDISRIQGVLVSHEHKDHAGFIVKCLESRIPAYSSQGTFEASVGEMSARYGTLLHSMESGEVAKIGNFKVQAFDTVHDAREPFGFLIYHPETGMVLFATDTYYLPYTFAGLKNIMIECNYRQDILDANVDKGFVLPAMRKRTMKSHMSFNTCAETLFALDTSRVKNVVLIHLSDGNSNANDFVNGIRGVVDEQINVTIAEPGNIIEL